MADVPKIRYATTSDDFHIAYQVEGSGSLDLLETGDGTVFSIDATGEQSRWQQWVDRLSSFTRFIRFDYRGVGLSDPLGSSDPPTVENYASDALAVMDAVDVEQSAILGCSHNGLLALLLAASHPERVRALVLVNAYARILEDDDYPLGFSPRIVEHFVQDLTEPGADAEDDLPFMAPSLASDAVFASWWDRSSHRGASPAASRAVWRVSTGTDLRSALPLITIPTLVLHSARNDFVPVAHGRYLAEHISGAQFVELDSADLVPGE